MLVETTDPFSGRTYTCLRSSGSGMGTGLSICLRLSDMDEENGFQYVVMV